MGGLGKFGLKAQKRKARRASALPRRESERPGGSLATRGPMTTRDLSRPHFSVRRYQGVKRLSVNLERNFKGRPMRFVNIRLFRGNSCRRKLLNTNLQEWPRIESTAFEFFRQPLTPGLRASELSALLPTRFIHTPTGGRLLSPAPHSSTWPHRDPEDSRTLPQPVHARQWFPHRPSPRKRRDDRQCGGLEPDCGSR